MLLFLLLIRKEHQLEHKEHWFAIAISAKVE